MLFRYSDNVLRLIAALQADLVHTRQLLVGHWKIWLEVGKDLVTRLLSVVPSEFGWSFFGDDCLTGGLHILIAPVVPAIFVVLSSNKIQNAGILVPAYLDFPEKMAVEWVLFCY